MAEAAVNGGSSTLVANIQPADVVIQIQAADVIKFPTSGTFRIALTDGMKTELCTVTGGQGTTLLTVTRASEVYAGVQQAYSFLSATPTTVMPVLTLNALLALMAQQTIPNANLRSDVARANQLVNGGFEIWQRTGSPFTVSGNYSADRWMPSISNTNTVSITKDTTNVDVASAASMAVVHTFNVGTTRILQRMEALTPLWGGRTVTFSVRVKTTVAATVRPVIYNGSAYVTGSPHTGDGTWQTLTFTVTLNAGSPDFYVGVEFYGPSCTAYLDNAMLVFGSVAADYVPLHPADDLARCQRYYEVSSALNAQYMGTGHAYSTGGWIGVVAGDFVTKPVAPTVTFSPASTWSVTNAAGSTVAVTSISLVAANRGMIGISGAVAAGLVAGNGLLIIANNPGLATITFEANP